MMKRLLLLAYVGGLTLAAAGPALAGDAEQALADELTIKSAGLPVDGAGLLQFFRLRTKGEVTPDHLLELIAQLSTSDPAIREKAAAELVMIGPPAVPALRKAAKDPDAAEAAGLARRCLRALETDPANLSGAAIRLIALRKPEGAPAALLAYLPGADDESLLDEIKTALSGMAYHEGKADAALLKALEDESPLRRATAIDVLCQNGVAEPRATLRKLLKDPTPTVRLRAALALGQARDAEAVANLIDLLTDLPVTQGRFAEEYLSALAADQAPKESLTDDASRAKVHDAWAAWWKASDGAALLDEFSKRTLTELDREKAEQLIRKLGDEAFEVRQKSKTDLKGMGVLVIPMLKQATNDADLEISQSARFVLQEIEKDKAAPLSPVIPRLIALRKPAGGVEAMLAYLPFCDDDGLIAEVQSALNAVAYTAGKPNPALVKALEDKAAVRRGAAAEALCFGPLGDNLAAVKKLLKDPQPPVRLQAALALAGARDKDAVPVVIASIVDVRGDGAWAADDYLRRMAADRPPLNLPTGDDEAIRAKRRDLWAAWWKDNGEKVALVDRYPPASAQRYYGYTILVQPGNNQFIELGADNKERFKMTGLLNPQDVQALPGDRFLITEGNGQRVTERDAKGDVKWTKTVPNFPISAQRLPNGNTFIVCRNQILEVSRDGREVFSFSRPNNDIVTAGKGRNGEIICISSLGMVQRLDNTGKELKQFRMAMNTWMVGNEILPNGNVIVAFQPPMNKVVEYDPEGKVVWESSAVLNPMAVSRSPTGGTLIVSQQWPNKMVEVDKNNKQTFELQLPIYTMRVRRR